MAANSKIEWTNHTWNPWRGCQHATLADGRVHPGCEHCYAEAMARRNPKQLGVWGATEEGGTRVRAVDRTFNAPLRWNAAAREAGRIDLVFVDSMSDFFEDLPELAPWRAEAYQVMERCRHLWFLILTKRPRNVERLLVPEPVPGYFGAHPLFLENVAILTSISDQQTADELLPYHEEFYGAIEVVGVSAEPLVGPVQMAKYLESHVDWVIAGGESGHHARPMHPDWARSLRDQCQMADVPFFFKQWGEWCSPEQMPAETFKALDAAINLSGRSDDDVDYRVGKKAAGRLLDGREWDEYPPELLEAP